MAKYMFQARASNGRVQVGQIDGLDENDVKIKLKARSLVPLRVVPVRTNSGSGFFVKRAPQRDLLIFTRQFATLINAGIPIVDSLRILGEGKRNELIKAAALGVRDSIEQGKRLAEGMNMFPNVFDKLYVNMIRAGEEAGILDTILGRLAIYMEKSDKIIKQIKGAMMYPIIIVLVAVGVVVGILVFIIPKFKDLFTSSGRELPGLTKMVLSWSNGFMANWYYFAAGFVAVPYLIVAYARTEEGKDVFDRILIRSPIFGELIQKSAVARMSRTLSTLLSSGVSVVDALEIAGRTAGNKVIEDALIRSKESVLSGRSLAAPLAKEKMIPDMVSQMIAIGEQSGTIDQLLGKIADFYEDDVENAVKGMTSMIEPLLMVFLGGILAFLVIAMYLPVFELAG